MTPASGGVLRNVRSRPRRSAMTRARDGLLRNVRDLKEFAGTFLEIANESRQSADGAAEGRARRRGQASRAGLW
jgi:hypothetical protein